MWRGILFSLLLLLFASMQTVLLSQYFYRMYLVGMWSKSALISAIYRSVNNNLESPVPILLPHVSGGHVVQVSSHLSYLQVS